MEALTGKVHGHFHHDLPSQTKGPSRMEGGVRQKTETMELFDETEERSSTQNTLMILCLVNILECVSGWNFQLNSSDHI